MMEAALYCRLRRTISRGMDGGPIDGSPEKLLKTQHPVAIVEEQAAKDLIVTIPELLQQKPAGGIRGGQDGDSRSGSWKSAARDLERRHEHGVARRPDAMDPFPALLVRAQHLPQRAEFNDQ